MKVDNTIQKQMSFLQKEVTGKRNGAADCKQFVVNSTNDRVNISSLIDNLSQTMVSEKKDQARSDRVDELKVLIAAGKYNVSGKAVAEKMLPIE